MICELQSVFEFEGLCYHCWSSEFTWADILRLGWKWVKFGQFGVRMQRLHFQSFLKVRAFFLLFFFFKFIYCAELGLSCGRRIFWSSLSMWGLVP